MTNNERIKSYAKLLIEVGLNVKKGQPVVISSPVDCAPFARMCASCAYDAGCREVIMNWTDDYMTREKYLRAEDAIFDSVHPWVADMRNTVSAQGAAWLSIYATDPETLSGVDPDRIRRANIAAGKATKPSRDRQMINFFPWCIASVPTTSWAKKVFPEKSEEEAVEALWDSILTAVRVYEGGDPVKEWQEHCRSLKARIKILNDYNFKYLKYRNSLGTDLTVELPEGHFWEGGNELTPDGTKFCANMPTEEVFTAPKKDGVNGIVYASKPLAIDGDIVENFHMVIQDGKIVETHADRGQKILDNAISVDAGASFLGEVALVPYDSPISNSGVLFFNTLFDENASCHLAFGEAYPCIQGGNEMSREELDARGLNYSIAHEDFMIGTPDLSIIGITQDGREIPVFTDGNFAF